MCDEKGHVPSGQTQCIFERDCITYREGDIVKLTRSVTTCTDPCGDIAPWQESHDEIIPTGKTYSEYNEWQQSKTITLPVYAGKLAPLVCAEEGRKQLPK